MNCELIGCMYNEDGKCIYDTSNIKIPRACACYDEDCVDDTILTTQN